MVARKSAAKPLAKKVTAAKTAKKTAPKKSSASGGDSLGQRIANAIIAGELDGDLGLLDDALTERSNTNAAKKTAAAPKSAEKKVSAPPKKSAASALVPKKDSTYSISSAFKPLAGAKVKFIRFKTVDGGVDKNKSLVEMLTDKPGNPKGKKVVIPTTALAESKGSTRRK